LNEGLDLSRLVTLVSAPAGYGKTTCISQWLDGLERCPVAWLSLEPADDDPGRFFTYLIAALQRVDANLGKEIEDVLHSGQIPPAEALSTTLINDMMELEGRFLLILDDFHVIQDRRILEVLERLITNPPQALHLVLLTREDPPLPLASLRAKNLLTEIRAQDLRFTGEETLHFLNDVMELSLSETDVAELEEKTEGWIVGLQLAGLSVQNRLNPSEFIASMTGSHRFILSYLTEQVLAQQPERIQQFLLQTSILDSLNGDLCNEVTERSDSRELLEGLYNANLFLIPLDDERRWYRYHHLFVDLLRELKKSLLKDKTVELHRRASRWYARAGMASESIQHALSAKDYATAVDLLESHAMEMIMNGYAKTVNSWVEMLPAEWHSQSPRTNLAFTWMHLLRGSYHGVSSYLSRTQLVPEGLQTELRLGEEETALTAEWLVMQSLISYMQGEMMESEAMAARALEIAPEQDRRVRSLAHYALASVYRYVGDDTQAIENYKLSIQHGQAAKNPIAEMMSTSGLALMAFERGQLNLAFEILDPVSRRVEGSPSLPPISTVIYGLLGEIEYQWVQIDRARGYMQRALRLSKLGGVTTAMINCHVLLSRLSLLEGDLDSADHEIQSAIEIATVDVSDVVQQELIAQQVRVYLSQNRPAAAAAALQGQGFSFQDPFSFPELPPGQGFTHSIGLLYNCSLHILLYQARSGRNRTNLKPGIELADRLIESSTQKQYGLVLLEALMLRAQMQAERKENGSDRDAYQADVIRALELAEPEGILGIFVEQGPLVAESLADLVKQDRLETVQPEYVERILDAISRSQPTDLTGNRQPAPDFQEGPDMAALVEPLTDREMDVLRLMAEGLKYKEIAESLFISLNTVRFHIKAIYGKLGVRNRTQAVNRARQLRIL
jgi:LuxR family maltose regulon positive regulatory protein